VLKLRGRGGCLLQKKNAEERRRNGGGGRGFDHQVIN
jgi:hypothetical protein